MTYLENVKDTKEAILEQVTWCLEHEESIDLSDIMHECVDTEVSNYSRQDCLDMIDGTGNEEYVDKGLIDNSDIDRMLLTTAYGCLEQEIYNDENFMKLCQEAEENIFDKNDTEFKELIQDIKNFI